MPIPSSSKQKRSLGAQLKRDANYKAMKYDHFMAYAPRIRVPTTLQTLVERNKGDEDTVTAYKATLETICLEELGPNQPGQAMSAIFVDKNDQILMAYFGDRIKKAKAPKKVSIILVSCHVSLITLQAGGNRVKGPVYRKDQASPSSHGDGWWKTCSRWAAGKHLEPYRKAF